MHFLQLPALPDIRFTLDLAARRRFIFFVYLPLWLVATNCNTLTRESDSLFLMCCSLCFKSVILYGIEYLFAVILLIHLLLNFVSLINVMRTTLAERIVNTSVLLECFCKNGELYFIMLYPS